MTAEAEIDLSARRLLRRIFEVEDRPDGSFLLKMRKSGEIIGGGWYSNERRRELPLEETPCRGN